MILIELYSFGMEFLHITGTSSHIVSGKWGYKLLINAKIIDNHRLVGGIPTPLKNMSSSVGRMTFPIYGKSFNISWFQSPPTSLSLSINHSNHY